MSDLTRSAQTLTSGPIRVDRPLLGVCIFPPLRISVPCTVFAENGLRKKIYWRITVFFVIGAIFFFSLLICLRQIFISSLSLLSLYGVLVFLLISGLILFIDLILEESQTLVALGNRDQPILIFDEKGFLDRRISSQFVRWDQVEFAQIMFGRGGVLGTKLIMRKNTSVSLRARTIGLRFDLMRLPLCKTETIAIPTVDMQVSASTLAPALYLLGNRLEHSIQRDKG
ncbi:hypothetical protein [Peteryoungia ipomoeae]|uniref:Uncharacterized protein n=1 Tax=Peteryoungia ipomoeae TaxID=1210932 RepID=A0A4S8P9F4_9HYPH|nr:hypothetical protein [Peteryoungia ipomoeae]THV25712.1 hypothetical protein FAA97_05880 [Peteryoungia ipomoeae]